MNNKFGIRKTCELGHHYYPSMNEECPICKKAYGNTTTTTKGFLYEEEETVEEIRPIAGWLVSIDGPTKGRDYRICEENNFVGRNKTNDICLEMDESISREKHSIISFDCRTKKCYYTPGTSRNLDRVNGEIVFSTIELKTKDVLEIGRSRFVFVELRSETFYMKSWKEMKEC